ncbi:MAG: Rieske 2Fe-2S domain-containing protein, partial [Rhodospirillales bacterium]
YLVYPAYAAIVAHISLGVLQDTQNQTLAWMTGCAAGAVILLHLAAALRELRAGDPATDVRGDWEAVCRVDEISEGLARVARLANGDRVAVFRQAGKLSAIANACAHQNGPLGEGRVIDCLVTCPWHGFQYNVTDGRSPAPFTEMVPTYRLKLSDGIVLVDPVANPPGTYVEPVIVTTDVPQERPA